LFCGARLFDGASVFCGLEGDNVMGFGGGKELPLLKGWLLDMGLRKSLL